MKFQGGTSPGLATLWLGMGLLALVVGEAAYQPSWLLLLVTTLFATGLAVWIALRGPRPRLVLGFAMAVMAVVMAIATVRTWRASRDGAALAAGSVRSAIVDRDRILASAVAGARQVARNALQRVGSAAPGRVGDLGDLLASGDLEQGLVVLGGDTVIAVAGAARTRPAPATAVAALIRTDFVRTLMISESRGGRVAQVSLLLSASAAVPAPGPSLASTAGSWQRVAWRWPSVSGVEGGGAQELFASADAARIQVENEMSAVPASPAELLEREGWLARLLAVTGIAVLAVVVLTSGAPPLTRALALLLPIWVVDRAGVAPAALGPVAMKVLLAAIALMLLAVVLWRRPARRNPIGLVASGLLLAMAPLLVALVGGLMAPPAELDSMAIWFGWQAVLALGTAAYLALASAPLRASDDRDAPGRWGWLATAAVLLIGALGIAAWQPGAAGNGWPDWYIVLWIVPFALMLPVCSSAARRTAIMTSAAVLAALAAWGASLDRRMTDASADIAALAHPVDSTATKPLTALGDSVVARHASRLPELYLTWFDSPVHARGLPSQLAVWRDTTVVEWVALDSLAASWDDLKAVVAARPRSRRIEPLARGAGRHHLLVVPLGGDTTVTVLVGPRSLLVRPTRFGRLVGWRSPSEPPYTLTPTGAGVPAHDDGFERRGRFVRIDRLVDAGASPLVVRATIRMSTPRPFMVRAMLTVLLDVLVILAAWGLMRRLSGQRPDPVSGMFRRSYRRTMATALISFFVVPAAFFTLWSGLRLRQEVSRRQGEDVVRALGSVANDTAFTASVYGSPQRFALAEIAARAGTEFGVYRRGLLQGASLDLLADLGVLTPVLNPVLEREGGGEIPTTGRPVPGSRVRISAERVAPSVAVAAVVPGVDVQLARDQVDLALLLLLASLGGTMAAIAVGGAVARALGQPIEALRQRAIAIGQRRPVPPMRPPPAEFEPVFGAIAQMEHDLGESEARLEEETARTARVVAWGEMARQVAHEIKNPLTPMRLGLQHLRRLAEDGSAELPEKIDETVTRLLGEIDRLDRIARSFARYGSPPNREAGPLEPVDLRAVVEELAELFALGSSGIEVVVAGDGEVDTTVSARREELMQVVLNLIDNARQASATVVTLQVGERRLVVRDDGGGIGAEQLSRIFEPTFSTTTSGTGLGLAIVRRLVESWGATIEVSSKVGEGTEFEIRFGG